MKLYTLTRFARTGDGVLGRLGEWYTLEEEDLGNQRNISCIPAGVYLCIRHFYAHGGYETFEVTGVPGRSGILIHAGNTEEDTEGCILLGKSLGVIQRVDEDTKASTFKLAVLDPKTAVTEFLKSMEGIEQFILRIVYYSEPS